MDTKPVSIPYTNRQRITAGNGVVLERQYVFMPPESWAALQRICHASQRSGSQVMQNLIEIADLGVQVKELNNEPDADASTE